MARHLIGVILPFSLSTSGQMAEINIDGLNKYKINYNLISKSYHFNQWCDIKHVQLAIYGVN